MKSLTEILSILNDIRDNSSDRGKKVMLFNIMIFQKQHEILPEDVREIFVCLAASIEYYEENLEARAQDPSFFGDDRLEKEIDIAFQELKDIGVST